MGAGPVNMANPAPKFLCNMGRTVVKQFCVSLVAIIDVKHKELVEQARFSITAHANLFYTIVLRITVSRL